MRQAKNPASSARASSQSCRGAHVSAQHERGSVQNGTTWPGGSSRTTCTWWLCSMWQVVEACKGCLLVVGSPMRQCTRRRGNESHRIVIAPKIMIDFIIMNTRLINLNMRTPHQERNWHRVGSSVGRALGSWSGRSCVRIPAGWVSEAIDLKLTFGLTWGLSQKLDVCHYGFGYRYLNPSRGQVGWLMHRFYPIWFND